MYTSCVIYLWQQRKARAQSTFLLAYITLVFVIETLFIAVQARTVQLIYIDNRNYPGGPWAYFLATQSLAVNVIFYATLFVITFLCDCLVVSRASCMLRTPLTYCPSYGAAGSFGELTVD